MIHARVTPLNMFKVFYFAVPLPLVVHICQILLSFDFIDLEWMPRRMFFFEI